MPTHLKRNYGNHHLHFLTCSCYHRQRWLGSANRRDLFLRVLEQVRKSYRFVVVGYVVMPEHIHLLIAEPEKGDPSKVMQAVKQAAPELWAWSSHRAYAFGEAGVVKLNDWPLVILKKRQGAV